MWFCTLIFLPHQALVMIDAKAAPSSGLASLDANSLSGKQLLRRNAALR